MSALLAFPCFMFLSVTVVLGLMLEGAVLWWALASAYHLVAPTMDEPYRTGLLIFPGLPLIVALVAFVLAQGIWLIERVNGVDSSNDPFG